MLKRFGVMLETHRTAAQAQPKAETGGNKPRKYGLASILKLFKPPLLKHSLTIFLYGLGWGLVNWGFLTFMPTMLRDAGFKIGSGSALLFYAALTAIPGTCVVAYLYGKWSSKKTMVLLALLTSVVLVGFALISEDLKEVDHTIIIMLLMALMVSSTGVIAMLSPYAAEVFPTDLRGTGSGFAALASKSGGMIGPPVMALLLTASASMAIPALAAAVPIAIAALVLAFTGIETRGRGLERLSSAIRGKALEAGATAIRRD